MFYFCSSFKVDTFCLKKFSQRVTNKKVRKIQVDALTKNKAVCALISVIFIAAECFNLRRRTTDKSKFPSLFPHFSTVVCLETMLLVRFHDVNIPRMPWLCSSVGWNVSSKKGQVRQECEFCQGVQKSNIAHLVEEWRYREVQ